MADLDRLKEIVDHAYRNSPYLREKWAHVGLPEAAWSQETFERIPFLGKEDLRHSYPDGMLAVPWSEVMVVHESSGTSGAPTPAFFTAGDIDEWFDRMLLNGVGLGRDDVVLVKTPYAMLTTAHQMHGAAQRAGAAVVPAGNRTELVTYGRAVRLLRDYRATVAYCMPVELMLLARKALSQGLEPAKDFPALRAAVVNGEVLSEAKRRFLEELWSVRLFPDYGSTETTSLGGACAHGTTHLWADRFHFEVYDPAEDRCTPYGTGEIVVTSYHRRATPIIRYRLGDVVTVRESACACGSGRPEVVVHGRADESFRVGGREFFPGDVEDVVYGALPDREPTFWSAEVSGDRLELSLESTGPGLRRLRTAAEAVREAVTTRLGMRCTVRVTSPGTLIASDQGTEPERSVKPVYLHKK